MPVCVCVRVYVRSFPGQMEVDCTGRHWSICRRLLAGVAPEVIPSSQVNPHPRATVFCFAAGGSPLSAVFRRVLAFL